MNMRCVAVQGNIGSGKSSAMATLQHNPFVDIVPEPLDQWGAWLELFYDEMRAAGDGKKKNSRSLGMQLQVLSSFHRSRSELPLSTSTALFERSPASSRRIFVQCMAQRGDMDTHEVQLYDQIYAQLGWEPELDIYIRCPPETCLKRIRARDRAQEDSITLEYLQQLHHAHEKLYANAPTIDGTLPPPQVARQLMQLLPEV